jgi:hypothetical protein
MLSNLEYNASICNKIHTALLRCLTEVARKGLALNVACKRTQAFWLGLNHSHRAMPNQVNASRRSSKLHYNEIMHLISIL